MSETDLLARLARQMILLEQKDAVIDGLFNMLAGVVDGSIARSRIMVNLTDRSVVQVEIGQSPSLPATINGVPRCVVAPPEPDPLLAIQAALQAEDASKAQAEPTPPPQ